MAPPSDAPEVIEERPLRELVLQLSQDAARLFEQEIALAKQEAREKVEQLEKGLLAASAGALVLHIGALALVAALILLLAESMPAWAASLVIGGIFCIGGALMLAQGKRSLKRVELTPEKTIKSVQKDVEIIKL